MFLKMKLKVDIQEVVTMFLKLAKVIWFTIYMAAFAQEESCIKKMHSFLFKTKGFAIFC
jgi:hypothetical protein